MDACTRYLADYAAIRVDDPYTSNSRGTRRLAPMDTLLIHRRHRAWLRRKLAEPCDGRTVVVTHHAPHRGSLSARYADDWASGAFVSELPDELIDELLAGARQVGPGSRPLGQAPAQALDDLVSDDVSLQFKRAIRSSFERFLRFTHRYWFHEISEQAQVRALSHMCTTHLGLDPLYDEVKSRIADMNTYLVCIRSEYETSLAAQTDAKKKADLERTHAQKEDAALAEVQDVVGRFNEQLKAWKAKNGADKKTS